MVGALTVAASASDNVGVAGVTFLRNGAALGPEDTQAPYSLTVQTDHTMNGVSTLVARARDAAGKNRCRRRELSQSPTRFRTCYRRPS